MGTRLQRSKWSLVIFRGLLQWLPPFHPRTTDDDDDDEEEEEEEEEDGQTRIYCHKEVQRVTNN